MELKEKVAYIKGLMEGMKFDTETNEGKLLTAIVGVLGDMAAEVTDMDEDVNELYNACLLYTSQPAQILRPGGVPLSLRPGAARGPSPQLHRAGYRGPQKTPAGL